MLTARAFLSVMLALSLPCRHAGVLTPSRSTARAHHRAPFRSFSRTLWQNDITSPMSLDITNRFSLSPLICPNIVHVAAAFQVARTHGLGPRVQEVKHSRRTPASANYLLGRGYRTCDGPCASAQAASIPARMHRGWGGGALDKGHLLRVSRRTSLSLHSTVKHADKVKEIDAQIVADDLMTASITSDEGKVCLALSFTCCSPSFQPA